MKVVNRFLELEDKVALTLETSRLADINMFISTQQCMNKSGCDIGLGRHKIHAGSKNHHGVNCCPLDDWSPSLKEVNTFNLHVAIKGKNGL